MTNFVSQLAKNSSKYLVVNLIAKSSILEILMKNIEVDAISVNAHSFFFTDPNENISI